MLLLLLILNTVLLIVILVLLIRQLTTGKTPTQATLPLPAGVLLEQKIRQVNPGDRRADVETLLGPPGATQDNEWIYYLDDSSGYLIEFSNDDRVDAVRSWVA